MGHALNTAIGEGATRVTVLQMALLYAAIANGGRLMAPAAGGADRDRRRSGGRASSRRASGGAWPSPPRRWPTCAGRWPGVVNDRTGHRLPGALAAGDHGRQDRHRHRRTCRRSARRAPPPAGTWTTPGSPASPRPTTPRSPSPCWSSTGASAARWPRRWPGRWSKRAGLAAAARPPDRSRARASVPRPRSPESAAVSESPLSTWRTAARPVRLAR